jgi:hypothetical protein
MRTAPRPKPVREPEEVDLIERVQDRDDGALNKLILQRGNPERPQPPIRLFGMYALRTGFARYAPRLSRPARSWRCSSSPSP